MEISLKKSHIHILESETLSRESRVTESAQEIFGSIPCKLCTLDLCFPFVKTIIDFVGKKEEGRRGWWVGVSIGFPFGGLGEPNLYHNLGEFTRIWGFY